MFLALQDTNEANKREKGKERPSVVCYGAKKATYHHKAPGVNQTCKEQKL